MKLYPQMLKFKTKEIDIGLAPELKQSYVKTEASKRIKYGWNYRGAKKNKASSNFIQSEKKQNCVTRISFAPSKAQHLKNLEYIQKEGKAKDGDKPELYGSDTEEEYKKNMTDKNWRIILSPDSNKIDLNLFTKEYIKKLEEGTGYKLTWIAANHYDTPHHHTHVLINSIDKNGNTVDLLKFKSFTSNLLREQARDICTSLIGPVSDTQYYHKLSESKDKLSYTNLDRFIEKYIKNDVLGKSYINDKFENLITDRLDYLVKMNFAVYHKGTQTFTFKKNWIEELKKMGKYNTFASGYSYAQCPPEKYYLHDPFKNGSIEGKILKKYTMQKDSNNFALIIKKSNGEVGYVPLKNYPKNCFVGDTVKIENVQKKTMIKNYTVHKK